MSSISRCKQIADVMVPSLQKVMDLGLWNIDMHILSKKSGRARMMGIDDCHGCAVYRIKEKQATIFLLHDGHRSDKQIKDTIVHEMIHIRLAELRNVICPHPLACQVQKYYRDKINEEDENTTRALTRLIMGLL